MNYPRKKKRKLIKFLILLVFTFEFISCASNNKFIKKNEMIYVQVRISRKNKYPIFFDGITKKINLFKISKQDYKHFIEDFFKQALYTPISEYNYKRILDKLKSVHNNTTSNWIKDGNFILRTNKLNKILLKDSSVVYIKQTRLKGSFYIVKKKKVNLSTLSVGLDINKYPVIKKIIIPVKIDFYSK